MKVYYNEFEPYPAQWLRNLMAKGLLPPGDVDERSIVDVQAQDLAGYDQCHFFAGIGGWPYALALAGWDGPAWTGSCPCQPLSVAGQRKGHADERHLWPAFHRLISERRPSVVFGEQVASPDGREWLAAVRVDLEADGYACGAASLCAAGVWAPHIRDRLYWVADAERGRREGRAIADRGADAEQSASYGQLGRMADSEHAERWPLGLDGQDGRDGADDRRQEAHGLAGTRSEIRRLADTGSERVRDHGPGEDASPSRGDQSDRQERQRLRPDGRDDGRGRVDGQSAAGPVNGLWRDADWLLCRDGKWRPVEPGTFPLAHGVSGRVGRLRAYGNAIVPQVAAEFVTAFMEVRP